MKMNGSKPYDLLVVGAGMGGVSAAFAGAELGVHVGLIERSHIGGT